jgi:hypothetical protein
VQLAIFEKLFVAMLLACVKSNKINKIQGVGLIGGPRILMIRYHKKFWFIPIQQITSKFALQIGIHNK